MTVIEHEHKFNVLSKFAIELNPNEAEKCRRFEQGLWVEIRIMPATSTYPSMRAFA